MDATTSPAGARVGRLAGAILLETGGEYFLVGNTKEPCDWAAAGFDSPAGVGESPYLRLVRHADAPAVRLGLPCLALDLAGEEAARRLVQRFVIARNGSVSERLWRLVIDPTGDVDDLPETEIDARWLGALPDPIWTVVRDTVLRCV
jgi:hypothetical protein